MLFFILLKFMLYKSWEKRRNSVKQTYMFLLWICYVEVLKWNHPIFYKKCVLKNSSKLKKNHLCKRDYQVFFLEFCKIFKNTFFYIAPPDAFSCALAIPPLATEESFATLHFDLEATRNFRSDKGGRRNRQRGKCI